jgi:hypothetical protein
MKRSERNDPYGPKFWVLTENQQRIAAALKEEYQQISDVIKQASKNGMLGRTGHTRWERLHIFEILEVYQSRRDGVYVRRGKTWNDFWNLYGMYITSSEDWEINKKPLLEKIAIQAKPPNH